VVDLQHVQPGNKNSLDAKSVTIQLAIDIKHNFGLLASATMLEKLQAAYT